MPRWAGDAVSGVGLDVGHRVVVRFVFGKKLRAEHLVGNFPAELRLQIRRRKFGQIIQRRPAGAGADFVDDFFAHERADAHVAVRVAGDGMAHHRVDADKAGARRNLHLAHNRAGPAENVREAALAVRW